MNGSKSAGRAIGLLLLVHLVAGLTLPYVLLLPVSSPPGGFLDTAAAMDGTVRLGVLMLFAGAAASLAIAILLWPLVVERHLRLTLCLTALALASLVLQVLENAHWLSLLSMSQAFAEAGSGEESAYRALGLAAHSAFRWMHYSHIAFAVGWLFALYLLFYRCAGVPRAMAALGMGTALLHSVGITLPVFGGFRMPYATVFGAPLGIATLAIVLWLLAKGLGPDASRKPQPTS